MVLDLIIEGQGLNGRKDLKPSPANSTQAVVNLVHSLGLRDVRSEHGDKVDIADVLARCSATALLTSSGTLDHFLVRMSIATMSL